MRILFLIFTMACIFPKQIYASDIEFTLSSVNISATHPGDLPLRSMQLLEDVTIILKSELSIDSQLIDQLANNEQLKMWAFRFFPEKLRIVKNGETTILTLDQLEKTGDQLRLSDLVQDAENIWLSVSSKKIIE